MSLAEPNDVNFYSQWEIHFRQIEPGAMNTQVTVRPSQQVTLLEISMDRAVHQVGCSPRDTVTLGMPLFPLLRRWRGAEDETLGLLTFGTAAEFDGVSDPGFVGLTVSIAEPFLTRVADEIGLPIQNELASGGSRPLRRWSAALQHLTESGRVLLHDGEARFGPLEQGDFVARLVLAAADGESFVDRSTSATRTRSVKRALDYLRERAHEELSIGEICTATGVSWRTLDRAFREQFGIGPKAYLNRFRLGQVRSDLLRGGPDLRIADAANAWGFWHMGQFAKDYRRMFGELPNQTLRS